MTPQPEDGYLGVAERLEAGKCLLGLSEGDRVIKIHLSHFLKFTN